MLATMNTERPLDVVGLTYGLLGLALIVVLVVRALLS